VHIYENNLVILLRTRNNQKQVVGNIKTHFLCFPEIRVVYETGGKVLYSQTGQR